MLRIVAFSLIFCLFLGGCQSTAQINSIPAKIEGVVSGQTLNIIIGDANYTLRLTGLDIAPKNLLGNTNPQVFLQQFFTDNYQHPLDSVTVRVQTNLQKKDKFDRISGYVWHNGELVNARLLREGYATVNLTHTSGEFDRTLVNAQTYGRIMEKGVWNRERTLKSARVRSHI